MGNPPVTNMKATAKQKFKDQYRFARMLTRSWWKVGNAEWPEDNVVAARRQAQQGFDCLLARQKNRPWEEPGLWGVHKRDKPLSDGKRWYCLRQGTTIQPMLPQDNPDRVTTQWLHGRARRMGTGVYFPDMQRAMWWLHGRDFVMYEYKRVGENAWEEVIKI